MRNDESGVGGFFEDLPVLVFVLAGVLCIMSTACWSTAQSSVDGVIDTMQRRAAEVMDSLFMKVTRHTSVPSVNQIRSINLSGLVAPTDDGFLLHVSIWIIHPDLDRLASAGSWEPNEMRESVSSRRLLNALDESGRVVIGEARVVVWCL
jgi:hypothetical protein